MMASVVSYQESARRRMKLNLAGFVLSNFMLSVFFAVLAFAVGPAGLGNIDLARTIISNSFLQ